MLHHPTYQKKCMKHVAAEKKIWPSSFVQDILALDVPVQQDASLFLG
jgi:hypothetical protein